MNGLVPLALYGWIPFVAILFATLTAQRAVIVAYVAGWLFLPVAGFQLFGFFDYTKNTAVPLVVFLGLLVFDSRSLWRLRWHALDLPVAIFCVTPLISSFVNDLGWYDALSALTYQTITWGLPYLTGRVYFSSPDGLRRLALGIFAGGLLYVPLCLWEIRMSPQLHATLYGFQQHDWVQTLRLGGYRPMVFMHHGLMLGLWMGAASLIGVCLWMSGNVRKLWGMPLSGLVLVLVATTVLCKSYGAIALLLAGALVLLSMRALRTSLPMALLACVPPTYVALRTVAGWSGAELTVLASEVNSERANSFSYRLAAEEQLRVKAAEKPLLGWGGWGRSFVRRHDDPRNTDTVVTDSLWILVFGKYGALGLCSLLLCFLAPVVALWRRCPPRLWSSSDAALPWALALVLTLYAIDNLVNAMGNPVYFLIAGGMCGLVPVRSHASRGARVRRPQSRSGDVVAVT